MDEAIERDELYFHLEKSMVPPCILFSRAYVSIHRMVFRELIYVARS